jgi:uncharacterized membrane-anchored protein
MIQFYFLAIVLNVLAGCVLLGESPKEALEFKAAFKWFDLSNETVRLVLGILLAVTGLFKILSPVAGDVPVIGDLVIALSSFLSGFILIFEYYRSRSTVDNSEHAEKINLILVGNKKIVGVAALVAAALHFLFPGVLLL